MPPSPPPLPTKVLQRVVKIATLDGWSILIVSGLATLAAGLGSDLWGALTGAAICTASLIELKGAKDLKHGKPTGLSKLVASQLLLLTVIWIYVGARWLTNDNSLIDAALTPEILRQLSQIGVDPRQLTDLLKRIIPLTYAIIALVSLAYQGGLAWFYHRQKKAVYAALS